MTLLIKSDVEYVGISQAKHILEYLVSDSDKAKYINVVVNKVSAEPVEVTPEQAPIVIDRLLKHLDRVHRKGATVLSIARTLKAIVFVSVNNISDEDFTAVSPYFGVSVGRDNYIVKMFGLDGSVFEPMLNMYMVLDNLHGQYVARHWGENDSNVSMMGEKQVLTKGVVMGGKAVCDVATLPDYYSFLQLSTDPSLFRASGFVASIRNFDTARSIQISIPKEGGGGLNTAAGGLAPTPISQGFATKVEYGTNANQVYVEGELIKTDTGDDISSSEFSSGLYMRISSSNIRNGLIESWLINSADSETARRLSVYLK